MPTEDGVIRGNNKIQKNSYEKFSAKEESKENDGDDQLIKKAERRLLETQESRIIFNSFNKFWRLCKLHVTECLYYMKKVALGTRKVTKISNKKIANVSNNYFTSISKICKYPNRKEIKSPQKVIFVH